MEKRKLKRWMAPSPIVIIVVVAVVVVVCVYAHYMREYFFMQAEQYVEQNTRMVASALELKIRYAQSGIQQMSSVISKRMDSPVLLYPNSTIHPLLKKSPFSRVDYIRSDGINMVNGEDPFDASDREYFMHGIRGESGVWINYMERNSEEALVNVYAPLVYHDSIVGVLSGVLGGRTDLRPILEYKIFGDNMVGLLCDRHLNIIASSVLDNDYGKSFENSAGEFLPPQVITLFRQHAVAARPKAFRFSTDIGTSIACVARVPGSGWFVVQMVPYHVLTNLTRRVTLSAIAAVLLVGVLFAIYVFSIFRANRRLRDESEGRHLNVINALTESYGSAFEVNLNTGHVVVYRLHPNISNLMRDVSSQEIQYDQLMLLYLKRMVLPEDRSLFDRVLTLDILRRSFIKQERFEFVYRIQVGEDIHYLQAHYVKPSKERSEFVFGIKLFDDFMSAEIEKRKELNEQRMALVKALAQARAADKIKSNFLFNMSHDIRTPMNAVLGYENLARKLLTSLKLPEAEVAVFNHYLDNIRTAGAHLLEMINSVLNLARVESGVEHLDEVPVLTAEMTDKIVATFEQAALQKNILIQVSRNFKNHYVYADKVKVQQILLNVVSNAIKYTREHGLVRISMKELPHETAGMCYIEMVVEDTGVGISEDFLPHIFDEFEREQTALTRRVEGTGLGLSIVKKLVDLMHGTINVTSRVGEGTKVVVVTPHRIANEVVLKNDDNLNQNVNLVGKRALLVDDDSMTCEIVGDMLSDLGIEVNCVSDGEACIRKLDFTPAGTYDVVLMDLRLPKMDGFDAAKQIRGFENKQKANIPIIALTANVFEDDLKKVTDVGMNGYVTKPVDASELFKKLSSALM